MMRPRLQFLQAGSFLDVECLDAESQPEMYKMCSKGLQICPYLVYNKVSWKKTR